MQFDICPLRQADGQLVLVLQHGISDRLETVIVAPLSREPALIAKVRRKIEFDGVHYVLQLDRLASVHRSSLGAALGSLSQDQDSIKDGLDLLFFGI